jgi:ribonuclease-3
LEFLWDAVLELTITELLFLKYPEKPEWDLTDLRSAIVKWNSLAEVSEDFWFWDYIILSKWEIMAQWNKNWYILANTLEAFLWALYLDLWYDFSKDFIGKHIFSVIDKILDNDLHIDPKSYLQEFTQNKYLITPTYEVLMESWQDHSKEYVIWVYVWDKKVWEWVWPSKKKAQKNAAINALENKNKLSNLFD